MKFEFATATRIIFGPGTLTEAGALARKYGQHALIVTGGKVQRAEPLLKILHDAGVKPVTFSVPGEPKISDVEQGTALAKKEKCDLVVGFGGGSALDTAKAVAVMLTNAGELLDYVEIIGRGKPLTKPSAPFIAIPTTAGTGSEVTRNAVLASPAHKLKVSLRSPLMLPSAAIVDPEPTYALPPAITANTGCDALTQLIEPFVCSRANPMTDSLCVEGLRRAARSLREAFTNGQNISARGDMALASLFGGLALSNAGLGAVHGFAGPIGGMFSAPHGAICAALLPRVMETNIRALRQRAMGGDALRRYEEIARLLTGNTKAEAEAGAEWVRQLTSDLQILRLGTYGVQTEHIPDIVTKAVKTSSMKANPVALTPAELAETVRLAL